MKKMPLPVILMLLPLILWLYYVFSFPFSSTIQETRVPIGNLSIHQVLNIQQAARRIDGLILKPGQEFSFNRVVGPRSSAHGYYDAPSYIWTGDYKTTGGGICVISSALYQAALYSGLKISERVPHLRTMQTVPAGLDATVWYGGADFRFVNSTSEPIQIKCKTAPDFLTVSIMGSQELARNAGFKLTRRESIGAGNRVSAEVCRRHPNGDLELVSRDLYAITRSEPTSQRIASRTAVRRFR